MFQQDASLTNTHGVCRKMCPCTDELWCAVSARWGHQRGPQCLSVSLSVSLCLRVSLCFSECLSVSLSVSHCLWVSLSVSQCLSVSLLCLIWALQQVSGGVWALNMEQGNWSLFKKRQDCHLVTQSDVLTWWCIQVTSFEKQLYFCRLHFRGIQMQKRTEQTSPHWLFNTHPIVVSLLLSVTFPIVPERRDIK